MRSRSDDIRKRIAKSKKEQERMTKQTEYTTVLGQKMKSDMDFKKWTSYEIGPNEESNHPLFSKEVFIFKILASACWC